jgi:hypothetical protein
MRVGDYVRIKNGDIGKIKENDGELIKYCVGTLYGIDLDRNCLDREVLKSSPNIIDLIEKGDYVNGEKVLFITKNGNTRLEVVCSDGKNMLGWRSYKEKEFKSIVTKEQFESMQYKVGE